MPRQYIAIFTVYLLLSGCFPAVRREVGASYGVTVAYATTSFTGDKFSGVTVLMLPVLTAGGSAVSAALSPGRQGEVLQKVRPDLHVLFADRFENKYLSMHSARSLSDFYGRLYNNEVVAVQTSDSVWKTMEGAYLFVSKLKYAAAIRGFDGNIRKRLSIEAEIWDIAQSEAVWRAELQGADDGIGRSDDAFMAGAFAAIFLKMPGEAGADTETDW